MRKHPKCFPPFLPSLGPRVIQMIAPLRGKKTIHSHSPHVLSHLPSLIPSSESLQPAARGGNGVPRESATHRDLFVVASDTAAQELAHPKCGGQGPTPTSCLPPSTPALDAGGQVHNPCSLTPKLTWSLSTLISQFSVSSFPFITGKDLACHILHLLWSRCNIWGAVTSWNSF